MVTTCASSTRCGAALRDSGARRRDPASLRSRYAQAGLWPSSRVCRLQVELYPRTYTVPTMWSWMRHWYSNVPAFGKLNV